MKLREGVARVDDGRAALAADAGRLDADLLGRRAGRRRRLDRVAARRRPAAPGAAAGDAADDELDLDAVADDPGEGLADQRAVARLEPVLGEAVGDRDPEAVVVDVDQLGVAQPRLVIGGRERHLQLAESRSPDLLRVHSFDRTCVDVGRGWVALAKDPSEEPGALERCSRWPTAPGDAASPGPGSLGFPGVPQASRRRGLGEDSTGRRAVARRSCNTPGEYPCVDGLDRAAPAPAPVGDGSPGRADPPRLTLVPNGPYHPPDDDAPCAFGRQARLRAFRGRQDDVAPRPDGEDPGHPR